MGDRVHDAWADGSWPHAHHYPQPTVLITLVKAYLMALLDS